MANDNLIRSGTATVAAGGTAVTGQSVNWSNVREGDFFGVHKGLQVPIDAVNGSTLTLAYPWPGAAQTAAAYAIQPQGDVARFSQDVRDLLVMLSDGDLAALAAAGSGPEKLPYYTAEGVAALLSLSAAAKTFIANGFSPVEQGGGVGMNTNKIRLGWSAAARLIAQVDGTAIGEVWTDFQSPKSLNSPGYVKLPNGLIIQWGYLDDGLSDGRAVFPLTFPTYPVYVNAIIEAGNNNGVFGTSVLSISTSAVQFSKRSIPAAGGAPVAVTSPIRWVAIGY